MSEKTRKIIQIAICPKSQEEDSALIALCDDGTVWASNNLTDPTAWKHVAGIPDSSEDEERVDPL